MNVLWVFFLGFLGGAIFLATQYMSCRQWSVIPGQCSILGGYKNEPHEIVVSPETAEKWKIKLESANQ